jgi:hypothetical protein
MKRGNERSKSSIIYRSEPVFGVYHVFYQNDDLTLCAVTSIVSDFKGIDIKGKTLNKEITCMILEYCEYIVDEKDTNLIYWAMAFGSETTRMDIDTIADHCIRINFIQCFDKIKGKKSRRINGKAETLSCIDIRRSEHIYFSEKYNCAKCDMMKGFKIHEKLDDVMNEKAPKVIYKDNVFTLTRLRDRIEMFTVAFENAEIRYLRFKMDNSGLKL